jgi:drug/metabolite transporter (DMT)-like permease
MTSQTKAYIFALSAVLMWSTVGSAFKLTLRYMGPVQMLWMASFISIIVLGLVLVFQGKGRIFVDQTINDWFRSTLFGLVNPFAFYIVLFTAYDLLLTQEAMVINFSWPVTLTILSILLLKQKISYRSVIAILVSFIGIIIIAVNGDITTLKFTNPLGVFLALLSTVLWSLFWIFNLKDKRDETVKLLSNFITGFILITGYVFTTGSTVIPSWQGVTGSLYIGVFEMGIAYILWLQALKLSTNTAKVSNLIFLAPFISLVIINLTVGESILTSTIIGLIIIIAGILLQRFWTVGKR